MKETIQEIRKKLRLAMNGVNSHSMRAKGIDYRMNLGLSIPQLKKIASQYQKSTVLAHLLWKENTRELKILATLLQPSEEFTEGDNWIKDIQNLELAEQACMNLFCYIPQAPLYAWKWIQSDLEFEQVTGYLLFTRLFSVNNYQLPDSQKGDYYKNAFLALEQKSLLIRNAALVSLKKLGRQSISYSKEILHHCSSLQQTSPHYDRQNLLDELNFEFDYYYNQK